MPRNYGMPLEFRFWEKVEKRGPNECWWWRGASSVKQYGHIGVKCPGGPVAGTYKIVKAHRVSWELHFGPIPNGLLVCHKCDNKKCVNPAHLYLGTVADNNRDARERGLWRPGRPTRGEASARAKLTSKEVKSIKIKLKAGHKARGLARQFGVTESAIYMIKVGKNWAHINV